MARSWRHDGLRDHEQQPRATVRRISRRDSHANAAFLRVTTLAATSRHWLDMGKKHPAPPEDFPRELVSSGLGRVNFFWPGYGENVRVLKWILERVEGHGSRTKRPSVRSWSQGVDQLDGLQIRPRNSPLSSCCTVNPD